MQVEICLYLTEQSPYTYWLHLNDKTQKEDLKGKVNRIDHRFSYKNCKVKLK